MNAAPLPSATRQSSRAWWLARRLVLLAVLGIGAPVLLFFAMGVAPLTWRSAVRVVGWLVGILLGGPGLLLAAYLVLTFIGGGVVAVNKLVVHVLVPSLRRWLQRIVAGPTRPDRSAVAGSRESLSSPTSTGQPQARSASR